MRRVQGIPSLLTYLNAHHYSLTHEEVEDLIRKRQFPHRKLMNGAMIFDLNHIDWWLSENRIPKNS
ncbi:hypothetical protein RG959_15690 [Domibacillus sp. 8LH]|uniref:hypothetical protein n=1 Tax=Domibacillus sp. 8LH TaxID=3073900 RepID=UPI00316B67AC